MDDYQYDLLCEEMSSLKLNTNKNRKSSRSMYENCCYNDCNNVMFDNKKGLNYLTKKRIVSTNRNEVLEIKNELSRLEVEMVWSSYCREKKLNSNRDWF